MTLCRIQFWIISGIVAWINARATESSQCLQALGVAVFYGAVATVLFFKATDMVREDPKKLAAMETTQCGELIFKLFLGIIVLHDAIPSLIGWIGIGIIVLGMVLTSLVTD